MYKIAAIGDRESILGFSCIGFETFEAYDEKKAAELVSSLAESDFAVIFVTEKLFSKISETVEKYKNRLLPAVVPVVGASGNIGIGEAQLRATVERAVGTDILR